MTTTTDLGWPGRDENGRTRQAVWRNSREAVANEPQAFLTPGERRERIDAFRRHSRSVRRPGQRWGAGWKDGQLMKEEAFYAGAEAKRRRRGRVAAFEAPPPAEKFTPNPEVYSTHAAAVLDYLMYFAQETGRAAPKLSDIAAAVGCAYRTAVRCVQQLRRGGWLEWERRCVRRPGGFGPQVEQTSNLYHFPLPNAAGKLIAVWTARRKARGARLDSVEGEVERRGILSQAQLAKEVEAVILARQKAHNPTRLFLQSLAACSTPQAVAAFLTRTANLDDALRKAADLFAEREFHEGGESRGR